MGCFGYICKGCGTSIRGDFFSGGELCVMKHVRHGEVLGEVVGHYDEYGQVVEEKGKEDGFRGDSGINSHSEICDSEFSMSSSFDNGVLRMYNGEPMSYSAYEMMRVTACIIEGNEKSPKEVLKALVRVQKECFDEFAKLPEVTCKWRAGIVAWHKKCYDEATEEDRNALTPSDSDPDQSWGEVREEFK